MNTIQLRNNVLMPQVGLGTWQITSREAMAELLGAAWQANGRGEPVPVSPGGVGR